MIGQTKEDFLKSWLDIFYASWEKDADIIEKREAYWAVEEISGLIVKKVPLKDKPKEKKGKNKKGGGKKVFTDYRELKGHF